MMTNMLNLLIFPEGQYFLIYSNWSVKGPTKNLYILIAEVVLMTVWGGVFPNQWEYYGLPLTSRVILSPNGMFKFVKITQDVNGSL